MRGFDVVLKGQWNVFKGVLMEVDIVGVDQDFGVFYYYFFYVGYRFFMSDCVRVKWVLFLVVDGYICYCFLVIFV